jgi:peptidoglycan hydrolase-like protein with peptidoglycan-binding domain
MGKVYSKLVESFGYIAEAPINQTGYDPEKVQYAYQDGKANPNWPGNKPPAGPDTSDYRDPRGLDNVTNDPVKDKPTDKPKSKYNENPGTRAYQHWLNSHGIKVAIDGKYGPQTQTAASTMFEKIKAAKEKDLYEPRFQESQTMLGVGTAHNVKPSPGTSYMWLNSPKYLEAMKKYGYDPKTGNPIPGFQHPNPKLWTGFDSATQPGQSGQRKTGALPSKQEDIILNSVEKLEAIFKKYGIQAECAYKDDGSLLTEDDWVLKHINMFSPQEQMEIWKILSEAELTPFGSVGADIAARRRGAEVASAYKDSLAAGQRYQQGATAAAQNMPQKQSTLSKFGKNLTNRFGAGGGKRAAAKGVAKLGLRAIPYIGTAVLLWDIGSALYDTFATTEIADLDPADQEIIAREIKNLTDMSKSADYASVSEETKKRVTAILNAANKLAQQAEA